MSKRIVAVIPARGGSKGIPKKNIINFCGKPLISWSISHIVQSDLVDEVYVSSDSEEILDISVSYGALAIKRPEEFSTDTATSESAIVDALSQIEKETSAVDLVVFLQATSPLRKPDDTDNSIRILQNNEADSLFSASVLEDFFIWEYQDNLLASVNYDHERRLRRQDVKPQFVENGSIYVFSPEIIKAKNNRLGGSISLYQMENWQSYEIDTIDDLALCEWYMTSKLSSLVKFEKLKANELDLVVYDFDGIMTDNRVLTFQDGTEAIMANRSDGLAINKIRNLSLPQVIISTEANSVVEARAKKLNLPVMYNIKDKKKTLIDYCQNNNYHLSRTLFVGNDINDLEAMKIVGCSAAPADAHPDVKTVATFILKSKGGNGVIREISDEILGLV